MAKNLFNYAAIDWYENELRRTQMSLGKYIDSLPCHIDGIEQYIYTKGKDNPLYPAQSVGVHLEYWTYWLDFWLDDTESLAQNFSDRKKLIDYYSGASTKEEWLNVIRSNIKEALRDEPEYLVWHLAEADFRELFTNDFRHTDEQVLKCTIDLFSKVADIIPNDVWVLFENLWFPGLHTLEKGAIAYFFAAVHSKHKRTGIMLDTGHLMNTNPELADENEAAQFICRKIDTLGNLAELIKGIHLSKSLSGKYVKSFSPDEQQIFSPRYILNHIVNVDRHRPFSTRAARQIIQAVQPDYIVHELNYSSLQELRALLQQQTNNILD